MPSNKVIIPALAALFAVSASLTFLMIGGGGSSSADLSDTPILVGPPGSRFWTTYANAQSLFGKDVVRCKTQHSDHRIGTAQDSFQNRYMSADKEGDNVEMQLVAQADNKYETAEGMQVLFHKCPPADAPWIAKSYSAFYLKDKAGKISKIGQIDSKYRTLGGMQRLMSKGMSANDAWTGDASGSIYRLQGDKPVQAGRFDRRWVTPTGSDKRMVLPLMMSKGSAPDSPWIGEYCGKIYVESAQ